MNCIRYEIHLDDSDTFIVIAAKGQLLSSEERPTAGKVSFLQWENFVVCLLCSFEQFLVPRACGRVS